VIATSKAFLSGVIEGFYGRPWSFELRHAYADFLAASGLNTYIYCPKSDPWLRKRWAEDWPDAQFRALRQLGECYLERGLFWGVGLSPFELYRHYGTRDREQLRRKTSRISELEAPLLAILFDDMPGDLDALAARQAEIVADVHHWHPEMRLLVCPTYYSFDPVLEKYFGAMPGGYWQQLGRELPADVDIFWTGNAVCSQTISVADIRRIREQVGRRLLLWDNYPVNDGAERSQHLYLHPLEGREGGLGEELSGHLCNPMNQGWLSLPALAGLAGLYGRPGESIDWIRQRLGSETWNCLMEDREELLAQGLAETDEQRRKELILRYQQLPGAAAAELVAWLRGEFAWDPACLTD
jgi:hypothetical protein